MTILRPKPVTSRTAGAGAVLALGLLGGTCGGSGSPTTPPSAEPPVAFIIVAGMNVLGIGQTTPFAARAYPGLTSTGLGPTLDVTRQSNWASSDPSVATVSSSGLVTARRPGTAEISATYKGTSYTVPLLVAGGASSEVLSRYVGTWSGQGTMTCQRLSGFGRNVCDFDGIGGPDRHQYPIVLTLVLAGEMLTGTLTLYSNPTTGPVQAAVLDTGALAIGGAIRSDEGTATIQLRDWRLTLTSGRRPQLVGSVFEDTAFVNVYSSQLKREQCQVDGLSWEE